APGIGSYGGAPLHLPDNGRRGIAAAEPRISQERPCHGCVVVSLQADARLSWRYRDLASARAAAGRAIRPRRRHRDRDTDVAWRAPPAGHGSRKRPGPNDAGREQMAPCFWTAGRFDCAGTLVTWFAVVATIVWAVLLCLITVVQTLYMESIRLRSRDLPALQFFKDVLEDRIGVKGDEGVLAFSLI